MALELAQDSTDTTTSTGSSLEAEADEVVTSNAPPSAQDWIAAGAVLIVGYGLGWFISRTIRRLAANTGSTSPATQITARGAKVFVILISVYVALTILGIDLGPLLAGAGIASIVLGFALKDIGENYVAGVVIGFSKPFVPGDRIVIEEANISGYVEELSLRYTSLREGSGVSVMVPNSVLVKSPLKNLTMTEHRRSQFSVGVGFEADIDAAIDLAIETLKGVEGVAKVRDPEAFVEEWAASWISIRLRFWHGSSRHDELYTTSNAITAVLTAFNEADIDMPYRVRTVNIDASSAASVSAASSPVPADGSDSGPPSGSDTGSDSDDASTASEADG